MTAPAASQSSKAKLDQSCPERYSRADYHQIAHRASDGKRRASRFERRTYAKVVRCQIAPKKSRPIIRQHQARYRRHHQVGLQWAYYRAHPLPDCTWLNESGSYQEAGPEWPPSPRYRVVGSDGDGGKYQIIPSTWYANGGAEHPYPPAANAPPLEQEKVARNVMASQGIGAWHGCG